MSRNQSKIMLNFKKISLDTNVNSLKTFLIRLINQYLLKNKSSAEKFNFNWHPILAIKILSFYVGTLEARFIKSFNSSLGHQKKIFVWAKAFSLVVQVSTLPSQLPVLFLNQVFLLSCNCRRVRLIKVGQKNFQ